MLLARKLSPEGYGKLNTILALVALFSIFSVNFSANTVITREVTLHPGATKKIIKKVVLIRAIALILSIIALLVYMFFMGETRPVYLTATSIILLATLAWDLAESIAFGHFITKLTTFISVAAGLLWFFTIFFLPGRVVNVELVLLVYSAIYLVRSMIYLGFSFNKYVSQNNESLEIDYKSILVMSLPYLWIRIMGAFSDQVPILLLKGHSGNVEVGYYALGNRFVMPITLAVSTGLRAMFPFMTKQFNEDREKFNQRLTTGFTLVLILGSSIAMVLTISSKTWIPLLFGEAYSKSVLPFIFQAWLGVLLCFDLILASVLSATYRQNVLAIIMSIDVLIIFPLMYLGSAHGADGMALAKLVGAFITITYHIVVVMVVLKANLKSLSFLLSCFYFAVMMIVTIFISDIRLEIALLSILIAGFLIYRDSPLREMTRLIYKRVAKKV
jgi:O-antigen/teichoic acid export membrane protein